MGGDIEKDISAYRVTKILWGDRLKLMFRNPEDVSDQKVLELEGLVAFMDHTADGAALQTLLIKETGGAYNMDIAVRLKRWDVQQFPEVFLFSDKNQRPSNFRAVARTIVFRDAQPDEWNIS